MYASCDRIIGGIAVLIFDDERILELSSEQLYSLSGRTPRENDMFFIEEDAHGNIISARYDKNEADKRLAEAKEMLLRLKNKNKQSL